MSVLGGTTEDQEPVVDAVEEPADSEAQGTDTTEAGEHGGSDDDPYLAVVAELRESGLAPEVIARNAKEYTQTRQELAEERKQLESLREIREAFDADADFAAHVMSYQPHEKSAEDIAKSVDERLNNFEARMATERALTDLHAEVASDKQPDFDDEQLLDFCIAHNIGDLRVGYTAMKHDDIVKATREQTLAEERRKREEGITTLPVGGSTSGNAPSLAEMESWSTAQWAEYRGRGK